MALLTQTKKTPDVGRRPPRGRENKSAVALPGALVVLSLGFLSASEAAAWGMGVLVGSRAPRQLDSEGERRKRQNRALA